MLLFVLLCLAEGVGYKDWPPTNPNPHWADLPPGTFFQSLNFRSFPLQLASGKE
jgi:hypothetical protein